MGKKKSSDTPFWVEHPEYYPDGPNTHLNKKPKFQLYKNKTSWKTIKPYLIGCSCFLLILLFLLGVFWILVKLAEGTGIRWLPSLPLLLLFGWLIMRGQQKIIRDGVKDALNEDKQNEH